MCFTCIGKGSKGCEKGSLCTYVHSKSYQASVSNRRCSRKLCHFYHVLCSLRPNYPGTALLKRTDNKKQLLTPLVHIKLPMTEKKSQLSKLPPNPIYLSQSTQPCVPIQCCCLPTPMALASGGSPMFTLVVHQPASPSIWPAAQSFRRGLSTNPGVTMWVQFKRWCVSCVWMLQRGHSGDGCVLASTLCEYDLRKWDLFVLSWERVRRVRRGSCFVLFCPGKNFM